jgi:hypothetical protein
VTIEELNESLLQLMGRVDRLEANAVKPRAAVGEVANDTDLDGKFGNPDVRKDPPLWIKAGGATYVGKKFSETTAEYLDALAAFFDWKSKKDTEKGTEDGFKYARYSQLDGARARGWAKRIRDGYQAPKPEAFAGSDDNLPF